MYYRSELQTGESRLSTQTAFAALNSQPSGQGRMSPNTHVHFIARNQGF